MDTARATLPGLDFTRAAPPAEAAPLRSDVAGFAGRTRRGPVAQRVRVEGWNDYLHWFGGLDAKAYAPYGLRGYFENGGQVAHVVRVGSLDGAHPARAARIEWNLAAAGGVPPGFRFGRYRIEASSPGGWANRTRIHLRYRRDGASGGPELDMAIDAPGENPEYLGGLVLGPVDEDGGDPLQRLVARRSALVRVIPDGPPAGEGSGPRRQDWVLVLGGGEDGDPGDADAWRGALRQLNDEPEVALLALPDLYRDLDDPAASELLAGLLAEADAAYDRLLLVDPPPDRARLGGLGSAATLAWTAALRGTPPRLEARSAAIYYPWLSVPDPLGGAAAPLKDVPPSGHVAGVISRLDRERGPHHTPANAPLLDAVDLAASLDADELVRMNSSAVNLLRCSAGSGLLVWGGSTLARVPTAAAGAGQPFVADHFIACRRLQHRLVRAIRRVAEALMFDTNGPQLWLTLVRAVNTVLLEAWHRGALKGSRPGEAFYVQCDDKTNPPSEVELGRCVCEIGVAPVAPMEFIVFRVALDGEGVLEVFES